MRRAHHGQAPACRQRRPEGSQRLRGQGRNRRAVAQRCEAPSRPEGRPRIPTTAGGDSPNGAACDGRRAPRPAAGPRTSTILGAAVCGGPVGFCCLCQSTGVLRGRSRSVSEATDARPGGGQFVRRVMPPVDVEVELVETLDADSIKAFCRDEPELPSRPSRLSPEALARIDATLGAAGPPTRPESAPDSAGRPRGPAQPAAVPQSPGR